MPNAFKNSSITAGITDTDVYTCPAATSAVMFAGYISNKDGTKIINIGLKVYDDSGSFVREILKDVPINIGAALTLEKIALEENDILRVICDTADAADAFLSVLEIT